MIGFLFIVVQYNLKVMDFYAWLPSDRYFPSALEEQVSLIRYSTSVSGFLRQAVFFRSID